MTTPNPPLTGRHIGECENALRAVLTDRVLTDTGLDHRRWIALLQIAGSPEGLESASARARLRGGLKIDDDAVTEILESLVDAGLATLTDDDRLETTPRGAEEFGRLSTASLRLSGDLFGGLDPADLVATARVLDEITRRANRLLAT